MALAVGSAAEGQRVAALLCPALEAGAARGGCLRPWLLSDLSPDGTHGQFPRPPVLRLSTERLCWASLGSGVWRGPLPHCPAAHSLWDGS